MAGVPVHTSSPISTNAVKAAGTTPTTSRPIDIRNRSVPAYTPASTTATSSAYPPARPGAGAGPAPTDTPQSSNLYPTTTRPPAPTQPSNAPPPPQPGAVPSPFVAAASTITRPRRFSIPPPPKAGEIPMPAAYYTPYYEQEQSSQQASYSSQTRLPPQMSALISMPNHAIPPSGTTSTCADLSHPPGYVQNSRNSFDERPDMSSPYQSQSHGNNSAHRGGLLGSGQDADPVEESPIAQVWKTATSWAKSAGEKLKEGEEEVWRRINEK